MSWHYLPELAAEFSEVNCSDGEPFVRSKLTRTAATCSSNANWMDAYRASLSGTMCGHSTGARGGEALTLCPEDSHVKTYRAPGEDPELVGQDQDSGEKWRVSLARYDRDSCSWKTRQCSLLGGYIEFSGTWPRWGMVRDGELFALHGAYSRIEEKDFSLRLFPTPCASEWIGWKKTSKKAPRKSIKKVLDTGRQDRLIYWPLWHHATVQQTTELFEMMMGWPLGWTELEPLATDKFRRWSNLHGIFYKVSARKSWYKKQKTKGKKIENKNSATGI